MPTDAARPRVRIVYRSHGGENGKGRPPYYSKLLALASMLRAAAALDPAPELVFLNDGPIPAARRSVMAASGEVVAVEGGSNRRSYRAAIAREAAGAGSPEDFLWFAEDDYLYRPDALTRLLGAVAALPHADYFALYGTDSLDTSTSRRRPTRRPQLGAAADPHAVTLDGVQWFRGISTTSTFGVRRRALREDAALLRLCPLTGGSWDTTTCLVLQGYQPFSGATLLADLWPTGAAPGEVHKRIVRGLSRAALNPRALRRPSRRRTLISSDPLLVTHMDLTCGPPHCLNPAADWPGVAAETAEWAAARGISIAPLRRPDEVVVRPTAPA